MLPEYPGLGRAPLLGYGGDNPSLLPQGGGFSWRNPEPWGFYPLARPPDGGCPG